ncbi:hypothetical protein KL86PLE_60346 [uncultured Pleomorphomonas sp.]|uniref:Uncharacterized protein n=1 Tax=uncultured Pleomorphomonas sp. TaxID=442121 RepID=A0A212LKI7_9HYPH|nr:hypothetical protein KL86PLE_60346 [uncultured Pleomorphomonas sp.]
MSYPHHNQNTENGQMPPLAERRGSGTHPPMTATRQVRRSAAPEAEEDSKGEM